MRKLRFLLVALLLVSSLTLTACGTSKDSESTENNKSTEKNESTKEADSSNNALQKIVDEAQGQLDSMTDDTMDIEITAKGNNTLVYTYTFQEEMDEAQIATMKEQLETGVEATRETFVNIANQLKDSKIKDPVVLIEYKTIDDEEIYSTEFTPE